MKIFIWTLTFIALFGLSSCGKSSDEAKELQTRIVKLVGIPQEIVANICQDDNNNSICESIELQAKVSFRKGDSMQTIWSKLTRTAEGRYLLETYNPSKPLLLELTDKNSQHFTKKFTLPFDGFKPAQAEKELSILEAMIDAEYLTVDDVNGVREMNDSDDFYTALLKDFEINLQTLSEKDLSTPRSVNANIKEVAEELLTYGIKDRLPNSINACNSSQRCIDNILTPLSTQLQIDENESKIISENETKLLKTLFAGKTLYSVYSEKGELQMERVSSNSELTLNSWEILLGSNKGEKGTDNISVEANRLKVGVDYHILVHETNDYILLNDFNSDHIVIGETKLYFNEAKAREEYASRQIANSDSKQELLGKTLYLLSFGNRKIEDTFRFTTNNKVFLFRSEKEVNYTLTNDKITIPTIKQSWIIKEKTTDYWLLGAYYEGEFSHDTRAYFNEAKARETLKSELEIEIEGKTKYFLNSKGGTGNRTYNKNGTYTGFVGENKVSGTYKIEGNVMTLVRQNTTIVLTYLGKEGTVLNFNISINGGETFQTSSYATENARNVAQPEEA